MHGAVAKKLCAVEGGYHAENTLLLSVGKICLKAHQVVAISCHVLLAELNNCIGALSRFGIFEPHRTHRAVAHGVTTPFCHDFYGHTAVKQLPLFKVVKMHGFCIDKGIVKCLVLLFVHGQVEIVISALAISSSKVCLVHVNAVKGHYGGYGIVKEQSVLTCQLGKIICKGRRRQRSCGNDCGHTIFKTCHFLIFVENKVIVPAQCSFNRQGKLLSVHSKCTARRHRALPCQRQKP